MGWWNVHECFTETQSEQKMKSSSLKCYAGVCDVISGIYISRYMQRMEERASSEQGT